MINVADLSFGLIVLCDKPTDRFYPPSNLLRRADQAANAPTAGLLCSPITKLPVNILFCLTKPVIPQLIVVKPFLGRHRVQKFSVFVRRNSVHMSKTTSLFTAFRNTQSLFTVDLTGQPHQTVVGLAFPGAPEDNWSLLSPSCLHSARSVCWLRAKPDFSSAFPVGQVLIRIDQLASSACVPCLGAVELWVSQATEPADSKLSPDHTETCTGVHCEADGEMTTLPDGDTTDICLPCRQETVIEACSVAPDHLIDQLTGDLMMHPIRLPSGTCVDRTSLERFWSTRQARQQPLVDPFTMTSLDPIVLQAAQDVEVAEATSSYLNKWQELQALCRRLDDTSTSGFHHGHAYRSSAGVTLSVFDDAASSSDEDIIA